jgi:hypothetical protein
LSRWGNEGFCNVQENVLVEMPNIQVGQLNDPSISTGDQEQTISSKWETQNSIEQLKGCFHDNYEDTFGTDWAYSWNLDLVAIGVLSLIFFIGIYIALKLKDSIKIK